MPPKTPAIILFVFIPFMTAYLLSELYRNINGVVGPVIQAELGLSIEYLGLMTGLFLAAIAGAQIFTGLWLDRFGPRKTVAALLLVGALGAVLFSSGAHGGLLLGRVLIGIGMAGCWTAAFMVNSRWFPAERLALANGAIVGLAGMGALFSTLPTQLLLVRISWNELFLGLAAATVAVSAVVFFAVPTHPNDSAKTPVATFITQLRGFKSVLLHPAFIRFAPVSALGQGAWISYQGLWAGVWLRQVDNLPDIPVAAILLALATAVVAGNLALGALADFLQRCGIAVAHTMTAVCFIFIAVQIVIALNFGSGAVVLWSLFGLCVAGSLFAYSLIARAVPNRLTGRAMSLLNLLATLCAFVMQYGIGVIIEFWSPAANGNYPPHAHQFAFAIIILCQVAAFLWLLRPAKRQAQTHRQK